MITTKQLRCLQRSAGVEKLCGDPELGDAIRAALETIKEQAAAIKRAMEVLETAPCGGIEPGALTMAQLDEIHDRGELAEDDAMYDALLTAWRILEAQK